MFKYNIYPSCELLRANLYDSNEFFPMGSEKRF